MKILLPIDGSTSSLEAVHHTLTLRRQGLQMEVVLANVQEPASLYEMLVVHDADAIDRLSAEAGLHALQDATRLLEGAGVEYECEVAKGDPAHTLLEIVERFGCDMVVMGARGTSSLRSTLLGSVSNEVLHACAVPAVVVKPTEPMPE
ncbi:MAG: universal stress protein [Rhodoferax sp.]|nr:universal stress protein [Rhodoferax sp.]